ncbi:MAG: 2-C-methyl-D-erythritol 2,4-cyclodiphosphate synthase [Candidatus Marinimicrobia bacterium]|nr:2-C-methyl-D-erythritol 2,4-cyclodiphosphate synthase [Candidatus Neomarinimicrobiota bacterium]
MNTKKHNLAVIIPAAGAGKRMKRDIPKILISIRGKTILEHTIRSFFEIEVHEMIIPVSKAIHQQIEKFCYDLNAPFPIRVIKGGEQRQDSIWNALQILDAESDIVAVHDAARPFFDPNIIQKAYQLLEKYSGVIAAVPATYTIKQVNNNIVEQTLQRETLWQINTPQIFKKDVLIKAYKNAFENAFYGTDDASLLERDGGIVTVVKDIPNNIKITTPADLFTAEQILQNNKGVQMQRIGQGYDVHRLIEGRKLILGGVDIPHDKGLDGHSDADVLVHAIMDALLGALALGDIGKHFPDNDDQYKNANSLLLLEKVGKLLGDKRFKIQNIDATLILQQPKVASHIKTMRTNIASSLKIDISAVSVKATTEEGLGFTGREEGIAAMASVMLNES